MLRLLYSLLLLLATPLIMLRLLWRGVRQPEYRRHWRERWGFPSAAPLSRSVWIHAVSVGEMRATVPLVQRLRAARPGLAILITCMTPTGRATAAELYADSVTCVYLPYDFRSLHRRLIARFRPALLVIMETEIWPNLLLEASRRGVPTVLANARLSERSARKARRFEALFRPVAESVPLVLAQTQDDADRLRAAGARRVEVCGNLKFDVTPDAAQLARGSAWKPACGRRIVLAASTREGEEGPLLAAWKQQPAPRPLLLIVPRHPQRFDEVAALVESSGLTCWRRSLWADAPPTDAGTADVWLGDSIGEMAVYFSCARVALLGGSFEPLGGQNLIEAAACGCPVLMGPHTFNFSQAADLALHEGAAQRVADIDEAVQVAVGMASEPAGDAGRSPDARPSPQRALEFAARHRGAAERMARQISALLG